MPDITIPDAAVEAAEQAVVGQALHVAAHGLQGHAQLLGQLVHGERALGLHGMQQQQLSGVGIHKVSF